jgi:hypothetical protein
VSVSLDDGAIDACGEAKVIGIDDQAAHRVSLAGSAVHSRPSGAAPARLTDFLRVAYTHSSAIRAVPLKRVSNGTESSARPKESDLAKLPGGG